MSNPFKDEIEEMMIDLMTLCAKHNILGKNIVHNDYYIQFKYHLMDKVCKTCGSKLSIEEKRC